MKKVNITLTFDDDKLDALEFSLRKEHSSVQACMAMHSSSSMSRRCRKLCGSIWTARLSLLPSPSALPNLPHPKRRIVSRRPWQPW